MHRHARHELRVPLVAPLRPGARLEQHGEAAGHNDSSPCLPETGRRKAGETRAAELRESRGPVSGAGRAVLNVLERGAQQLYSTEQGLCRAAAHCEMAEATSVTKSFDQPNTTEVVCCSSIAAKSYCEPEQRVIALATDATLAQLSPIETNVVVVTTGFGVRSAPTALGDVA